MLASLAQANARINFGQLLRGEMKIAQRLFCCFLEKSMRLSAVAEQGESKRRRLGDKSDGLIDFEMLEKVPRKLNLLHAKVYGNELHAFLDTEAITKCGSSLLAGSARGEACSRPLLCYGRRQQDGHSVR